MIQNASRDHITSHFTVEELNPSRALRLLTVPTDLQVFELGEQDMSAAGLLVVSILLTDKY